MGNVRGRFAALTGAAVLGLAMVGGAVAQDASPVASPTAGGGHPGHIHSGTCENLGEVVVPLPVVNIGGEMMGMATPMASPMASPMAGMMGASSAMPAAAVSATIDLALSDILAAEHAINYHESAENIGNYIACGAIGGQPDAQGNLFIGLQELNGSGVSGIAWLQESGAQTVVTVFLTASGMGSMGMATPTS